MRRVPRWLWWIPCLAAGLVLGFVLCDEAVATVVLRSGERVACPRGVVVTREHLLCRLATKDGAAGFIVRGFPMAEVDYVDVRF